MPKKVFWPATLVVMGLVILAAILDLLPSEFMNFWPLMLIIVGLGGLLTADRDEWIVDTSKTSKATKTAPKSKSVVVKKTVKPAAAAKSVSKSSKSAKTAKKAKSSSRKK